MYKYLKVKNFRCFEELELDELAQVNLIAGMNNVGKTALLEAIFLHGGYNPNLGIVINALRGLDRVSLAAGTWTEHPMDSLFNGFDVSRDIELVSRDAVGAPRSIILRAVGEVLTMAEPRQGDGKLDTRYLSSSSSSSSSPSQSSNGESEGILSSSEVAKVLELEHKKAGELVGKYRMIIDGKGVRIEPLPPTPPFQTFFQGARARVPLTDLNNRYGEMEVRREQDQVLRMLKIIEPRLKDIRSAKGMLHEDTGAARLIPLALMGDGMVRLAELAINIGNAPNGVVLVDEIENGLHHSIMSKVWAAIAIAARESNTQIFATTHSWACVQAAHQAFVLDGKYDFRLHRLGRQDDKIRVVTYDQETLDAAIEHGLEVR